MLGQNWSNFNLPENLIAQNPAENRTDSRLLVLQSKDVEPRHYNFKAVKDLLSPNDVLVINNTKVLPARFHGKKQGTLGKVEMLLSRAVDQQKWVALLSANRPIQIESKLDFPNGLTGVVKERLANEPGSYLIQFNKNVVKEACLSGHIPLPPYIRRDFNNSDRSRYQTVFADINKLGAVAAPTAGLHFDDETLESLTEKGVSIVPITLHVGPGTFLPIKAESADDHKMHFEPWEISEKSASKITKAKHENKRIIAVGTTCVRTLESAWDPTKSELKHGRELTNLFIRPGYKFNVVDSLITNFHLPNTTLLYLVSAFIGSEKLSQIYQKAVEQKYRFFSYGDACFFERRN